MSDNSKPVYDNPKLLLHWEREFIKDSIRWYVNKWRDFLEKNPDIKNTNIELWEARQEHIMEKLKQFQDQNEPEDDEEEDYEEQITVKGDNNE